MKLILNFKILMLLFLALLSSNCFAAFKEFSSGRFYDSACEEFMHTGKYEPIVAPKDHSVPALLSNPYASMSSIKLHHRLVKNQITYSMFFVTSLRILFYHPEELHLKSKEELKSMAEDVYRYMKHFLNKKQEYHSFKNLNKTRDLFFSVPEEILIEKIYENMLVMASQRGVRFIDPSWFNLIKKFKIRRAQLEAEYSKNLVEIPQDIPLYIESKQGKLSTHVEKINSELENVSADIDPSESLRSYADPILDLHRRLIKVYTNDFIQWMPIYDSQILNIRENLNRIKNGERVTVTDSKFLFNLLIQLFTDASEGTRQTMAVSENIVQSLASHIQEFNSLDKTTMNGADKADWIRKSNTLNLALEVHKRFSLNLYSVYNTITTVLMGLDQLEAVESSVAINRMGTQILSSLDAKKIADNILEELDHMDENVGELLPVLTPSTRENSSLDTMPKLPNPKKLFY